MTKSPRFFTYPLLLSALLLSVLGGIGSAQAQMDHSNHTMTATHIKPAACTGTGLECANAATPFLATDGRLLLAWTANGLVSFAQSSDNGKTFLPAVKVADHGKSLDAGADARPQIVADKRGNIFLAYAFFKDANWNAQINTARSTDDGKTFTTPKSLVNDGSSQRFPSVVIRPDNSIFISWIDKRLIADAKRAGQQRLGGSIAYAFSDDAGNTFTPEKIANENSCECCRIGVSLDATGNPVVVYRAIFPGGIRDQATQVISKSSTDSIRRVSRDDWRTDACPHHGPSIAIAGSGKIHTAWFTQGSVRSGVFYAGSTNRGESYSKPQRVGDENANVSRPYLVAINQTVWLAWKEFDGVKTSVYVKQSLDNGKSWLTPRVIASTAGFSDHPLLVSRGEEVYLSWLTRDDGYHLLALN